MLGASRPPAVAAVAAVAGAAAATCVLGATVTRRDQAEEAVWALREAYLKEEASASRLQRAVRAFLRNRRLRRRSVEVFRAARSGDVAALAR